MNKILKSSIIIFLLYLLMGCTKDIRIIGSTENIRSQNPVKYNFFSRETAFVRREPDKNADTICSLKSNESVFCYDNEHIKTEDGYWIKSFIDNQSDTALLGWIYTKDLDSSGLSIPPVPLNLSSVMIYPKKLKKLGIEGNVLTELWIDKFGKVHNVIIKQSAHTKLSELAEKTAYKIKFRPALTYPSKPIAIRLIYPINYKLE